MINLSGKHLKSLLALIERCQLDIVDCVRALESFAASSSEHGFAAWFREVVVEPLKDHGYHADPYMSYSQLDDLHAIASSVLQFPKDEQLLMAVKGFGPDSDREHSLAALFESANGLPAWPVNDRLQYLFRILNTVLLDPRRLALSNQGLADLIDIAPSKLDRIELDVHAEFVKLARGGCFLTVLNLVGTGSRFTRLYDLKLLLANQLLEKFMRNVG